MKTLREPEAAALRHASLTDDLHRLERATAQLHTTAHRAALLCLGASTGISHYSTAPGDIRRAISGFAEALAQIRAAEIDLLPRLDASSRAKFAAALGPKPVATLECYLTQVRTFYAQIKSGGPELSLNRAELFRFLNVDVEAALTRLAAVLTAEIGITLQTDRALAFVDDLTGLPNRRALYDRADRLWRTGGNGEPLVLLRLDLDRFKKINDDFGHATGDEVLVRASRIMRTKLREADFVARVGGDEFVALVTGHLSDEALRDRAHRIIEDLAHPFEFEGRTIRMAVSVGSARTDAVGHISLDRLLHNADLALYAAKSAGGARHHIFTAELRNRHETSEALVRQIERGLTRGEFIPYFQPQVEGRTGKLIGIEALARWQHPERGTLSPYHFLGAAEAAGLLAAIDEQITKATLKALRKWMDQGYAVPQVSINVSAERLVRKDFSQSLSALVTDAGLPIGTIALEILESAMIESSSVQMIETIRSLSAAGFRVELDDFGTGHSSIANLRHFKVDRVKIDQSFIKDVHMQSELAKITGAMIGLAHSLRIDALAEGVETAEERLVLNALGIDHIQGYGVAHPMHEAEVGPWIMRTQRTMSLPPKAGT